MEEPDTLVSPLTVRLPPTLKLLVASLTFPTLNALYAITSTISPLIAALVKPTVFPALAV